MVDIWVLKVRLQLVWLARGEGDADGALNRHVLDCKARESGTFCWEPVSEVTSRHYTRFDSPRVRHTRTPIGASAYLLTDRSVVVVLLSRKPTRCGRQ